MDNPTNEPFRSALQRTILAIQTDPYRTLHDWQAGGPKGVELNRLAGDAGHGEIVTLKIISDMKPTKENPTGESRRALTFKRPDGESFWMTTRHVAHPGLRVPDGKIAAITDMLRAWLDVAERQEDWSAFTPASELAGDEYTSGIKELRKILKAQPWIRSVKPHKNRLLVHAGDWNRYKKQRSDALDESSVGPMVEAIAARTAKEREANFRSTSRNEE